MIFRPPTLDYRETAVLDLIREQWRRLKFNLRDRPTPWYGSLRRSAFARGIRGSNSIEGYVVSDDDAAAAVEDDVPYDVSAEAPSWEATLCYRDAMNHALLQGNDPDAKIDAGLLRGLHAMMLRHDKAKHPGSWRPGPIFVHDDNLKKVVYEGPPREKISGLVEELLGALSQPDNSQSPLVLAGMAHLNLAMIHPFSDGNGRMARCLQTLMLAKAGVFDPVFCSIEEWLGVRRNTDEYYAVLSEIGQGAWNPQRDTRPWIRFILKAHYQQAGTAERRHQEAGLLWGAIERRLEEIRFSERAVAPLFEAALGRSIRNSRYRYHAGVEALTASRDLKALVAAGLLDDFGERRGRHYKASAMLKQIRESVRIAKEMADPFTLV